MESYLSVYTGNLIRVEWKAREQQWVKWVERLRHTERVSVFVCVYIYIHSCCGPSPVENKLKIPSGSVKADPISPSGWCYRPAVAKFSLSIYTLLTSISWGPKAFWTPTYTAGFLHLERHYCFRLGALLVLSNVLPFCHNCIELHVSHALVLFFLRSDNEFWWMKIFVFCGCAVCPLRFFCDGNISDPTVSQTWKNDSKQWIW